MTTPLSEFTGDARQQRKRSVSNLENTRSRGNKSCFRRFLAGSIWARDARNHWTRRQSEVKSLNRLAMVVSDRSSGKCQIMIFESARLRIRKLTHSDIDALDTMQRNPAVMKYITGRPKTREETESELEEIIGNYDRPEVDKTVMAVVGKADGRFIGACAIIGNEVGFRLDEPCWGQGYGRELFDSLVEYCFGQKRMHHIRAEVDEDNVASVRILDAGMQCTSGYIDDKTGKPIKCYMLVNPYVT